MRKKILHCVFEDRVEQGPDRIAIDNREHQVTYRELNTGANRLAHLLRQLGIGKKPVALLFNPGIEYITSLLAVFKSGAIAMPLNTTYPGKRLKMMLEESEAQVLVISRQEEDILQLLAQDMTESSLKWVIILEKTHSLHLFEPEQGTLHPTAGEYKSDPLDPHRLPETNPELITTPDDSCYIFYTSGSTGQPKAITGVHVSLAHFIHWECTEFCLEQGLRVSQLTPITFDPSLRDIFVPLSIGGTLCIPAPEERMVINRLAAWLETAEIQLMHIVPSLFRELTAELKKHRRDRLMLKSLRYALLAGEPLYGQDVLQWTGIMGNRTQLVNLYGPTETTLAKLFYRIKITDLSPEQMIPVGKPITNTMEMILDNSRLCRPGETGEVYIKTPFRSKGYFKNPELTAQVFIQNPLHNDFEDIVYKTGDLGRYLPDNNVQLTGRADKQIKINGVRIELGEIEASLRRYDKIDQITVAAKEIQPGKKQLVAYYTSAESLEETEIRSFLAQHLPPVMIPEVYVRMETLPLSLNGKLNKKALPTPQSPKLIPKEYSPPQTKLEKTLTRIWEEVTGKGGIGIEDRFFHLGAHSLQLLQIIVRIRKELRVQLTMGRLFSLATIKGVAKEIKRLNPSARREITPCEKKEYYGISLPQMRMWVLDQLQEEQMAYNIKGALHFSGELNETAFAQAFTLMVERHESLRTVFFPVDGEPKQKILSKSTQTAGLEIIHLDKESGSEEKVLEILRQESQRIFDLSKGPLLRIKLFKTGNNNYYFSYNIHHIIADGWSTDLMVKELLDTYEALCRSDEINFPALAIQYKDYAVWENQEAEKNQWTKQQNYWLQHLHGELPILELPLDKPRPKIQTYTGGIQRFRIPHPLTGALRELNRSLDTTPFMTLMSAYYILLNRYSGQQDIIIGSAAANRDREELEPLLGFFVNTLALRFHMPGNPTIKELLLEVKQNTLGAYDNQDYPFEKLLETLQPHREIDRSPLFQVAFTFHHIPRKEFQLPGITITLIDCVVTSKYDLTLIVEEKHQFLEAAIEYNTGLFHPSTIQRMAHHFLQVLEGITKNLEQKIHEIPLLSAQEKCQILEEWNNNRVHTSYPQDIGIHQWVEQQCRQTPSTIALVMGNQSISYGNLNTQSNRLAHYLNRRGVNRETLVGIYMERSMEMIISLLGILKSGGAYIPLSPSNPLGRLKYMIMESGLQTIITHGTTETNQPILPAKGISIDTILKNNGIESSAIQPVKHRTRGDQLAYIIYTSGSTGRPKGVLIQHAGIFNLVREQNRIFEIDAESRVMQFASFSFDAAISEVFTTLCNGAQLVMGTSSSILPGPGLVQFLEKNRITHVTLPPSSLGVMPPSPLPRLKTLIVAGEPCSGALVVQWSQHRRFINAYGPTEATVCATTMICSPSSASPPIGRPMNNVQVFLLDDFMQPVPIGVPGKIYISGAGVARGYLNNPGLTHEKFITLSKKFLHLLYGKSASPIPVKLYNSGDLGRWLPNGTIDYLGRSDNQVKIRGYRIENGEIESNLEKHPRVQSAVVDVRTGQQGNKQLAAYIIPSSRQQENPEKIELWPSAAEFYVYDDVLYYAMTHDERRNNSYKVAINQLLKDKVVMDIGTGKDAILSRLCAEAGAKKVYAIERGHEAYLKAKALVQQLGLARTITVIHGDATQVSLPEPVDVSISEIVGPIGGCEGAAVIMNQTRRHLKPGAAVIPQRSITQIAAVTLPDELMAHPSFSPNSTSYVNKIFQQVGYPFDMRLCLKNLPPSQVISNPQVFEDLDFQQVIEPGYIRSLNFTINQNTRLDGFLVWLNLHTITGEVIDILQHEYCWLPVFFPVFYPGIHVSTGDRIEATCTGTLCKNNLNPDYRLEGRVIRHSHNNDVIEFGYDSFHHEKVFRSTPFYRQLFTDETMELIHGRMENKPKEPEPPKESAAILAEQLKTYLQDRLPGYMIPAHFLFLEQFPITPNGKIHRQALSSMELQPRGTNRDYTPPETEIQHILSGIWARLLGIEQVGIHDNFFKLGGDSILCIQAAARANEAGLIFSPKQLFEYQTIAQLSPRVTQKTGEIEAEQGLVTGTIPLTSIQHWYFEQELPNPHHFNQAVLLEVPRQIDPALLEQTITRMAGHHDALRIRYTCGQNGWLQENTTDLQNITFDVEDLSHYGSIEYREALKESANRLHSSLDITQGPLARVRLFLLAPGETHRLLIIIHHLVMDGVSWRILLEDIYTVYQQLSQGKEVTLPAKTASFKEWSLRLTAYANTNTPTREIDYWLNLTRTGIKPIPVDRPFKPGWNANESYQHIQTSLSETQTRALLKEVPRAYQTHINDVLLAALALTVFDWTGNSGLYLDLEGHGREELFEGLNISRTIGWYTTVFPLILRIENRFDLGGVVKSVKEQLRRIPNHGINWGILRYLRNRYGTGIDETQLQTINQVPQPQLLFNYLGQTGNNRIENSGWKPAEESCGMLSSPYNTRTHQVEINGICEENRLKMTWTFSQRLYLPRTIQELAEQYIENLETLIIHCQSPEVGGYTPSDFPAANIKQDQLDRLMANFA